MTRRIVLIALALVGVVAGTATAAFISSTSNGPNSFTTRAVTSRPVITGTRITTNSNARLPRRRRRSARGPRTTRACSR